jgi:O-antigen/teichoic acid export membrane protein
MEHFGRVAQLATLAIGGQGVAYVLSIVLARRLGVDGFEAYAVASAAFTLMAVFAPRGIEKYALRLLPALIEREEWGHAHGFLRFGLRRTLWVSLLVGSVVTLCAWWLGDLPSATRMAIVVSCLSLPAGALVHYGVEILSASGGAVRAIAIFRVAVPTATLAIVGLLLALPIELTGAMAVGCWGLAWMLALAMMRVEIRRTAPPEIWRADPSEDAPTWAAEARPFRIYRISLVLVAQAAVIALDRLQPSAAAVGAYVAAMATANLALVLATATNRFYSRRLSVLLERREYQAVLDLRRERLRWLIPAVALFLALALGFTREVLALFRPEFVEAGVAALRLLAVATAFSVLFSLAPTYLKYRKHNRATLRAVAVAAATQVVLLALLVPRFAAMGAAIAYTVSMCGMYGTLARMAHRELVRLKAHSEGA